MTADSAMGEERGAAVLLAGKHLDELTAEIHALIGTQGERKLLLIDQLGEFRETAIVRLRTLGDPSVFYLEGGRLAL